MTVDTHKFAGFGLKKFDKFSNRNLGRDIAQEMYVIWHPTDAPD